MMKQNEIVVDLFAGGGGASEGIRMALGKNPDVAVDHDLIAISIHKANHPETWHLHQDVWQVPPRWATKKNPVGLLWASPDCTHFSKAKGADLPRDRKRRDLAWVVEKWAREVRPRVIILENVEEFKTWGPLDADGRIIKSQRGTTFCAFIKTLRRIGYTVEWRELRACDYGAPTIRKRLFVIARCDGEPIVWPTPSHGGGPDLIPHRTAAEIIDWSIPCRSIFGRSRPLAENTLKRIAEGLRRYVFETANPFIITYYGPKKDGDFRGQELNKPLPTQTTENRFGLVTPVVSPFITEHANSSMQRNFSATEPLRTQCATVKVGHFALVAPHLQRQFGKSIGSPYSDPVGTITAGGGGKTALVSVFLAKHYSGVVGHEIERPAGTITTKDHHSLVTSHLLKLRGTCRAGQSMDEPIPTLTAGGTHVAEVRAFLIKYYGTKQAPELDQPLHTITTKDRFGVVTINISGKPYIITDIGMRMLSPRELFRAQGFPDSYQIDIENNGKKITKSDQVRLCGNSVCPPIAAAIVGANAAWLAKSVAA